MFTIFIRKVAISKLLTLKDLKQSQRSSPHFRPKVSAHRYRSPHIDVGKR